MNRRRLIGVLVCAIAAVARLGPAEARADLIAGDSYFIGSNPALGAYAEGVFLRSQPANLAGIGFVDGPYAAGTGTSQFAATSSGLNFAALGATAAGSGKVTYSAAPLDNLYRANARLLAPGVPASDSYWISHTVNRGNIPAAGGNGFILTGFGNAVQPTLGTTGGFLSGLFVGFSQSPTNPNSFGDLVIRHRDSAGMTAADVVLVNGAQNSTFGLTYNVVMRLDVNVSGAQDQVTWWLNPTDLSSVSALSASSAATGGFSSFALAAPTDFLRLNYASTNWNGNAFFDEPRLATTLAGLSRSTVIPEPSSVLLVAAGLAGVFGLRRSGKHRRRP